MWSNTSVSACRGSTDSTTLAKLLNPEEEEEEEGACFPQALATTTGLFINQTGRSDFSKSSSWMLLRSSSMVHSKRLSLSCLNRIFCSSFSYLLLFSSQSKLCLLCLFLYSSCFDYKLWSLRWKKKWKIFCVTRPVTEYSDYLSPGPLDVSRNKGSFTIFKSPFFWSCLFIILLPLSLSCLVEFTHYYKQIVCLDHDHVLINIHRG